jgi:hypothetical protein
MSAVNLIWVLPTANADGSVLALANIASVQVFRDNTQIATLGAVTSYSDSSPPSGNHDYQVSVTDTGGHTSALDGTPYLNVPVPLPTKPNPVTGLTATYVP